MKDYTRMGPRTHWEAKGPREAKLRHILFGFGLDLSIFYLHVDTWMLSGSSFSKCFFAEVSFSRPSRHFGAKCTQGSKMEAKWIEKSKAWRHVVGSVEPCYLQGSTRKCSQSPKFYNALRNICNESLKLVEPCYIYTRADISPSGDTEGGSAVMSIRSWSWLAVLGSL